MWSAAASGRRSAALFAGGRGEQGEPEPILDLLSGRDGLDEVKDSGRRNRVVEEVKAFYVDQRGRGNRFVLTSRIVGYAEVRPCAEGLGECTLLDFGDEEIESFVTLRTGAVER